MSFVDLLSALLVPREHGGERRILSRVAELGLEGRGSSRMDKSLEINETLETVGIA